MCLNDFMIFVDFKLNKTQENNITAKKFMLL